MPGTPPKKTNFSLSVYDFFLKQISGIVFLLFKNNCSMKNVVKGMAKAQARKAEMRLRQ